MPPAVDDSGVVLAIDLGTGGPKVALVDGAGRVLGWRSQVLATTFVGDGGAEQDPVAMWQAVVSATRALLAEVSAPPVMAVAVTSQYMSTIPVRADGSPTGPCVMWMDARGAADNRRLLNDVTFPLFSTRHGLIPLPAGTDGLAHAAVLRREHPDAYGASAYLVEPMDYLTARLTRRVTATQSTMFGMLACDNRVWGGGYDPELVAASGLDPHRLPPLVSMTEPIGPLHPEAADELGLPAGLPVLPGTIDSITGAVGCGALDAASAGVVIGTTSVTVTHVGAPTNDLFRGVLAVPSPLPERWFVLAENGVGGRALEWALATFGAGEPAAAIDAAMDVPVGADGVAFYPWLLGSLAPAPDDDQRGALTGLSLRHDRRHVVRAVLEGIALNLAWMQPVVEEMTGHRYRAVRFGGGGALSAAWAQILADALDLTVERIAEPRATNARGAALLAWWQLGVRALDELPALVPISTTHHPDPAARPVMAAGLQRLVATHAALAAVRSGGPS
jgi:xylulokinase